MHVFSCLQLQSSQTCIHSHKYYACVNEHYSLVVFCISANFTRTLGLIDFLHFANTKIIIIIITLYYCKAICPQKKPEMFALISITNTKT